MNISELLLYDAKWWLAPKKSPMLSKDDLVSVLTSRDLKIGAAQIFIGCETLEFSYIVKKLELSFSNFNPTSIDSSNLFYSKKGNAIKKGSLYNANQREPYKKAEIDNIFNHL